MIQYRINQGIFYLAILLILWITAAPAKAHEWYPPRCCHGKDCAKATVVKRTDKGITLKHPEKPNNTYFFAWTDARLQGPESFSEDEHWHLCLNLETTAGVGDELYGIVLCVFRPNVMG